MRVQRTKKILGQSTVELALLMPIVAFLLYLTIQGFGVNHNASENSIQDHAEKLAAFNHGNGFLTDENGIQVPAGQLDHLVPGAADINIVEELLRRIGGSLLRLGLNKLLDGIDFLSNKTILSGMARGGITAGLDSWISSGFRKLDMEDVGWGAVGGGASSLQATEILQGDQWGTGGSQELFGSGLQKAIIGYAQSEGDWKGAVTGAATGMLNSDTANNWFDAEKDVGTVNDLLKGAARGAIEGSVAGLVNGKLDLKTVAIAGGMGAFNTKTVANLIPGSQWNGDSRKSATFGATSAAVGTFIRGGTLKEAVYSASAGALFSGQSMHVLAGDSPWIAAGIGATYGAGVAWIEGENGVQVLMSAGQNMLISAASAQFQAGLQEAFGDKKVANDPGKALNEEREKDAAKAKEEQLKQTGHFVAEGVTNTAIAKKVVMPTRTDANEENQEGVDL